MFKKARPQKEAAPVKARRKLTPAEKREIRKVLEAARGDGKPHSAQDTLPFRQIYPDGLCKLDDKTWSRCIEFEDVNYQLAQPDGQTAIFEALCDMYNAHDASIGMELSLVCRKVNREDFRKRIEIAAQGDRFDGVRALYTDMLRRQLEHGNNGMVKTKFLVLTIEADNLKTARARFSRIVLDALNHFKAMGALAKELDGKEWLEVLHGILHPDGDRFRFEWDWLAPSGLHVKDFICPSSFRFGEARRFQMGGKFGAVSFLQITAPEMNDRLLADLLDTDSTILVSLHIRSMDQNEAIKTVKRKITDLDSMKIDAQKRAAREGFDIDILPSDLATYAGEAKNILRDLQSRNERMFLMTFLVVNFADSKQKLDNDLLRAASVAQKYNCSLVRLDFQQEDSFVSSLPLGVNRIKIQRGLTTSSVSIFVPFISQELFQGGEALYYGLNATSGNMILADRKQLKTPNGLILGTPGSGKSFSAKREILNVFLVTTDDIIICDPEAEYFPLVHRLGGQVIKISPTSSQYVNPMDMSLNYSEDDNPLALKSDFILSFCELAAGGRNGLEPVEKTLIDRAVRTVYRPYLADPRPENVPILGDLYDEIKRQPEPEAQRIAAALELYVHGSLNVFNHRTNVDINRQAVCTSVTREKKKEQPPKLYDLTTLQREANRIFGYTAKQTLDYAQSLYEKKLLTYPRTDSRYLTSDMAETASCVIHLAAKVPPFDGCGSFFPLVELMVSDKDVTDHHAIIPTMEIEKADMKALPVGERNLLLLVCCKLLCASANPYEYEAVTATFDCGGHTFMAKGKRIWTEGWREIERIFRSSLKEKPEDTESGGVLPDFTEGQTFEKVAVSVTEHFTSPPKPYTEDTLLSAMENAGKEDIPEDAERKGLGTPATRAAIIEKLVAAGFVERKGKNLIPTKAGINLVTVLPEALTSPMLTAEWEQRLSAIAKDEADPGEFMEGIRSMTRELVQTYSHISEDGQKLFAPEKEMIGNYPRCGKPVYEGKKNFACSDRSCTFVLWKNDRFWTSRKKELTKKMAADLLKKGRTNVKGMWSEKKGVAYDAAVILDDTGGKFINFKLEFPKRKDGVNGRK